MVENDTEAADALDDVVAAREAKLMRDSSRAGKPLHEIFAPAGGPALVVRLSALQQRLTEAASRLRRAQARHLRHEGLSTERIAEMFGVTRQRISALLRLPDQK